MIQPPRIISAIFTVVSAMTLAVLFIRHSDVPAMAGDEKPLPEAPWSIRYHDHSGNGYRFWKSTRKESARFEYSPIQPENSSSGIYSGGRPRKGMLAAKPARELWRRVRKLAADTALHAKDRAMGTGAFTLKEAGKEDKTFIIRSGPALKEFDSFLTPYREQDSRK